MARPGDGEGVGPGGGQRPGFEGQQRDVAQPVGAGADGALAGEAGEGPDAGEGAVSRSAKSRGQSYRIRPRGWSTGAV